MKAILEKTKLIINYNQLFEILSIIGNLLLTIMATIIFIGFNYYILIIECLGFIFYSCFRYRLHQVIMNKSLNKLIIVEKNIITKNSVSFSLTDIKELSIHRNAGNLLIKSKINLILIDDKDVLICSSYRKKRVDKLASIIINFLDNPNINISSSYTIKAEDDYDYGFFDYNDYD